MQWITDNWIWLALGGGMLALGGGMLAMHMFGHGKGGHGKDGHGKGAHDCCSGHASGVKPDLELSARTIGKPETKAAKSGPP